MAQENLSILNKTIKPLNLPSNVFISNTNYQHLKTYRQYVPMQLPHQPLKTYKATFYNTEIKFALDPFDPNTRLGAVVCEGLNKYCRKNVLPSSWIIQINDFFVSSVPYKEVLKLLQTVPAPITITFHACETNYFIKKNNNYYYVGTEPPQTKQKERIIRPKGVKPFSMDQLIFGPLQRRICVRRSFSHKVFFDIVAKALNEGDRHPGTSGICDYRYGKYGVCCNTSCKEIHDIGIKEDGDDIAITVVSHVVGGKKCLDLDYETVVTVTRRAIASKKYTRTKSGGYRYQQDGFGIMVASNGSTVLEFLPHKSANESMIKKKISKSVLNVSATKFTPKSKSKTKTKTQMLSPVPEENINAFIPAVKSNAKNPSAY